jgi:nucleotide-binding universal stress UspA family protein
VRVVTPHRILVAVDGSDAGRRALEYVAEIAGARPGTTIRLLHLLPPIPPSLLEHGGAEEPRAEEALDEELREGQRRWLEERQRAAQLLLDEAQRVVEAHGTAVARIERECRPCVGGNAVARECLEAARESGCSTVALARQTMPWYRELLHQHQGDAAVRHGRGLAVWVIG